MTWKEYMVALGLIDPPSKSETKKDIDHTVDVCKSILSRYGGKQ